MRNFILAFSVLVLLSGCAKFNNNYFESSINTTIQAENSYILADDMVKFLTSKFVPNKTTFLIFTDDLNKDFYNYLTNQLRNKGYGISEDNKVSNLTFFSYQISNYDENKILVIYNINDQKINRAYEIINNKLVNYGKITSLTNE